MDGNFPLLLCIQTLDRVICGCTFHLALNALHPLPPTPLPHKTLTIVTNTGNPQTGETVIELLACEPGEG